MASLIAVVLFAILFNAFCITEGQSTEPSEDVGSTSTSNSTGIVHLHRPVSEVVHGPKTLAESLPEDSNGTELPATRNDTLEIVVPFWLNETRHNESDVLVWQNESRHDESEDDSSTEGRFDDEGCDTHLRDQHEEVCYDDFAKLIEEARNIEDEAEKGKHICCASEGYERCCVVGYREANCDAGHRAMKESLKAARLFVATLSDTSCALHRGRCGFGSAATPSPLHSALLLTLGFLPLAFLL